MPIELYNQNGHRCLTFTDLCDEAGDVVQSNQFPVVDGIPARSSTRAATSPAASSVSR